ncbi:MAG: hypothetical protein KKA54_15470 [Proteobacteria bacterium]|nr:hypothetical protein [Pseudomonadota bacterium]
MFQAGLTIARIAEERGLVKSTIEGYRPFAEKWAAESFAQDIPNRKFLKKYDYPATYRHNQSAISH